MVPNRKDIDVNLVKLADQQMRGIRHFLEEQKFVEVFTPLLNTARERPFRPAVKVSFPPALGKDFEGSIDGNASFFLAHARAKLNRVYSLHTEIRPETRPTSNHLTEFRLGEIWREGNFNQALKLAEDLVSSVISTAVQQPSSLSPARRRELKKIKFPFQRVTYKDVINKMGFEPGDLTSEQGQAIVEAYGSQPIFITHPPQDLSPHLVGTRQDSQGRALDFDLLLPFSGEALSGGVLETNEKALWEQFKKSQFPDEVKRLGGHEGIMGPEERFTPYVQVLSQLDSRSNIRVAFAFERIMQFLVGTNDIAKASALPVTVASTAHLANPALPLIVIIVDDIIVIGDDDIIIIIY